MSKCSVGHIDCMCKDCLLALDIFECEGCDECYHGDDAITSGCERFRPRKEHTKRERKVSDEK